MDPLLSRKMHVRCYKQTIKNVFLKVSQNSQENTCAEVYFIIKFKSSGLEILIKKRLQHSCFLVNLRNFQEHLFYRTPRDNSFWMYSKLTLRTRKQYQLTSTKIIKVHSQGWDDFWQPNALKKIMKNAFYFALKSSFHSQDIYIFIFIFSSCRKMSWLQR